MGDREELGSALERWVDAGIITAEQRSAIDRLEAQGAPVPGSRVSAVVEVFVYLGIAAVVGSVVALLSQFWSDLGMSGRVGLLGALAVGSGVGGSALRGREAPPLARASAILWMLSSGFVASMGATIATTLKDPREAATFLLTGGPAFILSLVYWRAEPRAAQLLAVIASGLFSVFGLNDAAAANPGALRVGLVLAVAGAVQVALARAGLLAPTHLAQLLGSMQVLIGLWIPTFDDKVAMEAVGIVASLGFLWLSVQWRAVGLLAAGAVGLFTFVSGFVLQHLADSLGVPLALLLAGAALIGAAILVGRLQPLVRSQQD
ncbi:MAG: DUF2157 domain-containing protein [Actinomycetota bacterium]